MTSEILLHLEHVTRTFGQADRLFTAVNDINLDIHQGEFVALLGPSGCGKSTLLRMITGLIAPRAVLFRIGANLWTASIPIPPWSSRVSRSIRGCRCWIM